MFLAILKKLPFVIIGILMTGSFAFAQTTGTFMVVKGDVQVTSKDGKTEKAKLGKKVFPSDTITSGADSRAKIVMADKNVINISPDTKLVLEKYIYDAAKGEKSVTLNVLQGKVRATVEQKYDGEQNTFNVKTPAAVAGVRGTDFLTSFNAATKESRIVTFEGKVAVGLPGLNGKILNPVFVSPGQQTTVASGKPPAPPVAVPKEEFKSMSEGSKAESNAPEQPDKAAPSGDKKDKEKDKEKEPEKGSSADSPKEEPKNKEEAKQEPNGEKPAQANNDGPKDEGKPKNEGPGPGDAPKGDVAVDGPKGDGPKGEAPSGPANKGPDSGPAPKGPDAPVAAGPAPVEGGFVGSGEAPKNNPPPPAGNGVAPTGMNGRAPASGGPVSMIDFNKDVGGLVGGGNIMGPTAPTAPVSGIYDPTKNRVAQPPPTNDYVKGTLQNGSAKVNITIVPN